MHVLSNCRVSLLVRDGSCSHFGAVNPRLEITGIVTNKPTYFHTRNGAALGHVPKRPLGNRQELGRLLGSAEPRCFGCIAVIHRVFYFMFASPNSRFLVGADRGFPSSPSRLRTSSPRSREALTMPRSRERIRSGVSPGAASSVTAVFFCVTLGPGRSRYAGSTTSPLPGENHVGETAFRYVGCILRLKDYLARGGFNSGPMRPPLFPRHAVGRNLNRVPQIEGRTHPLSSSWLSGWRTLTSSPDCSGIHVL